MADQDGDVYVKTGNGPSPVGVGVPPVVSDVLGTAEQPVTQVTSITVNGQELPLAQPMTPPLTSVEGGFDHAYPVAKPAPGLQWYGNSILKLDGETLEVKASFTPRNGNVLRIFDSDLGAGGPTLVLAPDGKEYLIGGGKEGVIYSLEVASWQGAKVGPGFEAFHNVYAQPPSRLLARGRKRRLPAHTCTVR